jgi:hypothetical protein
VAGRVLPSPDTGGIAGEVAARGAAGPLPVRERKAATIAGSAAEAMAAPLPAPPAPAQIEAAQAAEGVTETVFTLPYKISVTAGQRVVLPILDRELPTERIDLYQSSIDQHHPLAAVALSNNSETGLPPGVLTLYEQVAAGEVTYLGDARLAVFPLGEKRMLSYAVDAKVTVDRSSDEQHAIVKAAVAQGVMRLTRLARQRPIG